MSNIISTMYTVQGKIDGKWKDIKTSSVKEPSLKKATIEFNLHSDFKNDCPDEIPYDDIRLIKETAVQIR